MKHNSEPSRQRVDEMNRQVNIFNHGIKVGARVTYKRDGGDLFHTRTRGEAYILSGHTPVVFVEGMAGCVLLSRVTPDKEAPRYTDTPCGRCIRDAELALKRDLSDGEKVDLLLDRFMELANSDEARAMVASVTIGPETSGEIG